MVNGAKEHRVGPDEGDDATDVQAICGVRKSGRGRPLVAFTASTALTTAIAPRMREVERVSTGMYGSGSLPPACAQFTCSDQSAIAITINVGAPMR
jgi:hypothetical protein